MRAWSGLALCLLCAAGCGGPAPPAGPLGLEASLEPERLPLGAAARLQVRLRRDPGVEAPFPPVQALLETIPRLALVEQWSRSRSLAGGASLEEREYSLRLFEPGRIELPIFTVEGKQGDTVLQASGPTLILEALTALEGHAPEVEEPLEPLGPEPRSWLPPAALALGGAALLALLGLLLLRRRRAGAPPAPALPAHEAALQALAKIRSWPRSNAADIDALVVACSGVVRSYIEAAFGLQAPDRTTEEFLVEAESAGCFASEPLGLLGGFLVECDRVKFAAWTPPGERQEALLAAAERFIRSTAPQGGTP